MRPIVREEITSRIERLSALDALAEPLQQAVRAAVPQESELKDALTGIWLGHPLHPPLTDLVLGACTSALLLDLLAGQEGEHPADLLVAAGVIAAVPTAAAGLSDWAELRGGSRRVGSVHALGNTCGSGATCRSRGASASTRPHSKMPQATGERTDSGSRLLRVIPRDRPRRGGGRTPTTLRLRV